MKRFSILCLYIVGMFFFAILNLALAQSCPKDKYPFNGQCFWLHEIECPRGQEYDIFKEKCKSCEEFGKIWMDSPNTKNKYGGYCNCRPCEEETGDGCTPCYDLGARCDNGKCVNHSREYQGPRKVYSGFADSLKEIKKRLEIFKMGVSDLEAQLGSQVEKAFGYCECKNPQGVFVWAHAINDKAVEVKQKIKDLASKCEGCAGSPKMEVSYIEYSPKIGSEKGRQMMGDGKSYCCDGWCCSDEETYNRCEREGDEDAIGNCLKRSGCEVYGE